MYLAELKKLHEEAAKRTPGEWGKGEGYYGFIDREDGRYFCGLHNLFPKMIECMTLLADVVRTNLEDGKLTNEQYEWHRQAISAYNKLNSEE